MMQFQAEPSQNELGYTNVLRWLVLDYSMPNHAMPSQSQKRCTLWLGQTAIMPFWDKPFPAKLCHSMQRIIGPCKPSWIVTMPFQAETGHKWKGYTELVSYHTISGQTRSFYARTYWDIQMCRWVGLYWTILKQAMPFQACTTDTSFPR